MKLCQVDIELLIHFQKLHLKMKEIKLTIELRLILKTGETTEEQNTNPTENTQQNLLQISESFDSEMFTGQTQNPSVEL